MYGLPTWYKYLDGEIVNGQCEIANVDITNPEMFLPIGLAVMEILLRIAAMVAVAFVVYGGFQYMTSQGEPDKTKSAKDTILNAVIGVLIALFATAIVRFIGARLG